MRVEWSPRRAADGGGRSRSLVRVRLALVGLLIALVLGGCGTGGMAPVDDYGYGPAPPGYYRVRRGDTLGEIAQRKRVSWRKLARWNGIGPPYTIYSGKLLRVKRPKGGSRRVARPSSPRPASRGKSSKPARSAPRISSPAKAVPASAAAASGLRWQWPMRGPLRQTFRAGDRTRQGIRIGAKPGAKVAAAADGSVVYSGSGLKGYGNLIIVKHSSRYLSAYGFNQSLLVGEGERVKRGQTLAEVGKVGNGEYMLHFEIRRDGTAVDPLRYLPR